MAPIRALVRPVPTDGLEDFKDLALPLDVQVLQHDADSETAHVSVPTEGAFSALQNLPGYTVTRVEEPQQQQQQQQQTKQQPVAAASAAADSSAKTTTSASGVKRKVLPSSDVFYLITDMNMVVPCVCLLLLLHIFASLCFCIWSPPLITAALPIGALLLLHACSKQPNATQKQHIQ